MHAITGGHRIGDEVVCMRVPVASASTPTPQNNQLSTQRRGLRGSGTFRMRLPFGESREAGAGRQGEKEGEGERTAMSDVVRTPRVGDLGVIVGM